LRHALSGVLVRYNPAMKAYVTYYGPEPKASEEETEKEKEDRLARPCVVQFHKTPLWTLPAKDLADVEVTNLQWQRVFVGQHFCRFSVEELPEGKFAVVCLDHTDWS
jgi:hypothetical protein